MRQEEGSPLLKPKHLGMPQPRPRTEASHEHKPGGHGSADQCDGHLDNQQEGAYVCVCACVRACVCVHVCVCVFSVT